VNSPGSARRKILLAVLLFLAGTEFVVRGPVRFLRQSSDWNDLVPVYVPSHAWLTGVNPYDPNVYADLWTQTFDKPWSPAATRSHAVYPVTAFVLLSPLAALPWPVAQIVACVMTVLLVAVMIWCMIRFGGLEGDAAYLFAAGALALAPFQTGLATGNISIAVVAVAGIAAYAIRKGEDLWGGILLAAAVGLKPQIGLCFLGYYLLRRQWRVSGVAILGLAALFLAAALRMHALGFSWIGDFLRNNRVFVGANRFDDFTAANPIRFTLIDLQVPLLDFTASKTAAALWAACVVILLAVVWLVFFLKTSEPDDLLNLGVIATLSLLPVYHRFYDAALLVFPLCWLLRASSPRFFAVRIACAMLLAPFLFPGATMLADAAAGGRIPQNVLGSWVWRHLLMPHEIWALLLLVMVLLAAVWLQMRQASSFNPKSIVTRA
jgi:glycosyl transferase family 87